MAIPYTLPSLRGAQRRGNLHRGMHISNKVRSKAVVYRGDPWPACPRCVRPSLINNTSESDVTTKRHAAEGEAGVV